MSEHGAQRKLMVIGFDGMDPDVLERMWDRMPHFKRLADEGAYARVNSTFPADSIPAWTSIYTGLSSGEHGVLSTFDYFNKKDIENLGQHRQTFQGKTFWDIASQAGRTVTIVNPFMAYPAWEVNGVFVAGAPTDDMAHSTYPESIARDYALPPMGAIPDFPDKDEIAQFVSKTNEDTEKLQAFSLRIFKDTRPDLFFVAFLTSDRIQHFLWRYCDPNDPTYPGPNPNDGAIDDFYVTCDRILGEYLEAKDELTNVVVLSDHGHGMRCTKVLNLNEFLRQNGYLHTPVKQSVVDPRFGVEKLKTFALNFLTKYDLQDYAWKIARWIPNRRALKKSSYIIDKDRSICYVSEICGTNPQGGIDINPALCPPDSPERDALCAAIIEKLMALEDPETGRKVTRWAKRREEVLSGEQIEKFPEIVFELEQEYGVNWSLFTPLVDVNPTHKKLSGGHRPQGIFLTSSRNGAPLPRCSEEVPGYLLGALDVH